MRKNIAAGNWKMNLTIGQAHELVSFVIEATENNYNGSAEVIFAPSFPFLSMIREQVEGHNKFHVAAQNIHHEEKGAFTGEVSASMLSCINITHTLIGHSERRLYFHETNELLAQKVSHALQHHIRPIFCLGETLAEREEEKTLEIIQTQLKEGIFHLDKVQFEQLVIAYEPVWAIGTGRTATPEQAQEVHAFIRQQISTQYDAKVADDTSILYGGSVKPHNADALFSQPDIDGGLVGGASLKGQDFVDIIKALS